ncbi:MAG: CaiB/BaiF CoA transferase family protein [Alphaproteobacteria bacterium]
MPAQRPKRGTPALAKLKVLDLTRLLPGAFCSLMLADHGAEVIKIEQPGNGDYNRSLPPINVKESGSFLLLNRNKQSLTLNLKTRAGKKIFLQLVDEADVVLEGFRPGVMHRLGLDYPRLARRNPRLIYCAISGFGQDGPYREASGHDINYMGIAGALQLFAMRGGRPIVPGLSIADVGGGSLMALFGILTAVVARQASGLGQLVDVSMTDGVAPWLCYHAADFLFAGIEPKGGERALIGEAPCYNVYRCEDGKFLTLGIIEEHFWHAFCGVIGRSELKDKQWPSGEAAVLQYDELAALFATAPRDAWVRRLRAADVPAGPVNSMAEAFADPQFKHRGMLQYVAHPIEGRIPQFGHPVKFSRTPGRVSAPPPVLGEHTDTILSRCGYDQKAIARLREQGVV